MWTRVVDQKYITPLTSLDWIRLVEKSRGGCFIIWKAVIQSFGLIGSCLVWRVGNGRLVWVGLDPWVGCGGAHILPVDLRLFLSSRSVYFLSDLVNPRSSSMWHQGWLSQQRLGLSVEHQVRWSDYLAVFRNSHIKISVRELVWEHYTSREYTPKNG